MFDSLYLFTDLQQLQLTAIPDFTVDQLIGVLKSLTRVTVKQRGPSGFKGILSELHLQPVKN